MTDGLLSGRVDLARGRLLDDVEGLESLAAAADTLLASDAWWESVFGRLGGFSGAPEIRDVVVISARAVHVALRGRNPEVAIVSVAPTGWSVGLVLAEARRALEGLDEEDGDDGVGR